jgi:hypothetical protein
MRRPPFARDRWWADRLRLRWRLRRGSGLKLHQALTHGNYHGLQTSVLGGSVLDRWRSRGVFSGRIGRQNHLLRVTPEALSILRGRWRVPSRFLRDLGVLIEGAVENGVSASEDGLEGEGGVEYKVVGALKPTRLMVGEKDIVEAVAEELRVGDVGHVCG